MSQEKRYPEWFQCSECDHVFPLMVNQWSGAEFTYCPSCEVYFCGMDCEVCGGDYWAIELGESPGSTSP
jgi:hypothetical protein